MEVEHFGNGRRHRKIRKLNLHLNITLKMDSFKGRAMGSVFLAVVWKY